VSNKIRVIYSDCSEGTYDSVEDAESAILEAHAEGAGVESVYDLDGNVYSCLWDVKLQKEV
jgi:hypothetical protein